MPAPVASITELLGAPPEEVGRYLDLLVPEELRRRFDLPERASWERGPVGTHRWSPGDRPGTLQLEVWPRPGADDPALVVHLADLRFGRLELSWIALNDVDGPRYHVDRDPQGNPIPLGSGAHNRGEDLRALADGLTPNQVRPGLHAFRSLIRRVEQFARGLAADTVQVVPMAYHNALQYERYGFTYSSEELDLAEIHRQFQPGGVLCERLDGSSPFRAPELADTIRGRSWAIYDGVLGHRWVPPAMYKFTERDFTICTFPGATW